MTVRFKKVRDFERLQLIQQFEQDIIKDDIGDIYEIDNKEIDVDPDEMMDYGLISGYMSA
ncbi:TPA: hypothetical protein HA265_02990 [Candidatus Woesearchaeota archaeon]|nr:hypothetical protein [Candidatus Woesearchaeota archaeon]